MEDVTEWLRKTGKVTRVYLNGDRCQPPAVIVRSDFWRRPPFGPPLAGRRATAGGRGHRRSQTDQAKAERRRLAYQAYALRRAGHSIRDIATALGVGKTTVGKWLYGVYPASASATHPWPRRGGGLPRNGPMAFYWESTEEHRLPCPRITP
jgi:hypothetical protein